MPITAVKAVPVTITEATAVLSVALSGLGGSGRMTGCGCRCVEGVFEVSGHVDEGAGRCGVEDDAVLGAESWT